MKRLSLSVMPINLNKDYILGDKILCIFDGFRSVAQMVTETGRGNRIEKVVLLKVHLPMPEGTVKKDPCLGSHI